MKYDLTEKKVWITPSIEEAPVQITQGGILRFTERNRGLLKLGTASTPPDDPDAGS